MYDGSKGVFGKTVSDRKTRKNPTTNQWLAYGGIAAAYVIVGGLAYYAWYQSQTKPSNPAVSPPSGGGLSPTNGGYFIPMSTASPIPSSQTSTSFRRAMY